MYSWVQKTPQTIIKTEHNMVDLCPECIPKNHIVTKLSIKNYVDKSWSLIL